MSTPIESPRDTPRSFFDSQFRAQVSAGDYALNPFEQAILPHLWGEVLDLGCGLGNLALAAAARGCRVSALDASQAAITDLARRATERRLTLEAHVADLRHYVPGRPWDCVVSIGLLMFFACDDADALLRRLIEGVKPRGLIALNVLTEGTTWLAPFGDGPRCLFAPNGLTAALEDWEIVLSRHDEFPADGNTVKRFHTLVARRPDAPAG